MTLFEPATLTLTDPANIDTFIACNYKDSSKTVVGAIEEPHLEIYHIAESVHHHNQIIPEKKT